MGNGQEGFEYNSCFSLFNCTVVLTVSDASNYKLFIIIILPVLQDKGHSRIEEVCVSYAIIRQPWDQL